MKINWDAFDLQLILDNKPIDLKKKYQEDLRISKETINDNLMDQPALFAFYSVMSEIAEAVYEEARLELELLEATLDEHYRKVFLEEGQKVTEKKLEKVVATNSDRIESAKAKIQTRKNRNILKALTESMRHRKEAVISLASNYRAEMDVDVYIKKKELKKEKY